MYAVKLHNVVRRKLGLTGNAEKYSKVTASDIDSALEEATILLIENMIQRPEINGRVREDLRVIKRRDVPLEYEIGKGEVIAKLPDNYYRMSNVELDVKIPVCGTKTLQVNFLMDQDYREALKDDNWKPSFEWGDTIGENSNKGVHIAINPEMTVTGVRMDLYVKPVFPIHVDIEESIPYKDMFDKLHKGDTEPTMVDNFFWRRVTDVAEVILTKDQGDYTKYQTALNNIVNLDNLYTN